jgi:hypothetical protein
MASALDDLLLRHETYDALTRELIGSGREYLILTRQHGRCRSAATLPRTTH